MPLAGRPLVEWSIAAFRAAPSVRSIVVACPPGHVHDLAGHDLGVVDGGTTRSQSVSNALEAVGTDLVAIHDAARPLVTADLIEAVLATLVANPAAAGVIAATPVTDTIKQTPPGATLCPPGRGRKRCTSIPLTGVTCCPPGRGRKRCTRSNGRWIGDVSGRRRRLRCFGSQRCGMR